MLVPIKWSFQRKSILPIIEVIGESDVGNTESLLVKEALDVFEKAEKFKGKPYPNNPNIISNSPVSLSLSIIFPSEIDINNYMEFIQKSK